MRLELPKPVFVGTPRFIVSANLGPVRGTLREPFPVPPGVRNLALGRPVSGNDPDPFVGTYALVTDGDKEARGDTFLEMGPGLRRVDIDLGVSCRIYAIVVWHYHGEPRVYRDVVVQVSPDAEFAESPVTLFNNDHDNSSGLGVGSDKEYIETYEGLLVDAKGTVGRYVRLYSHGSTADDMNDCTEVEVYGLPANEPEAE